MGLIAEDNVEAGRRYAMENMGDDFVEEAYSTVVNYAKAVVESERYAEWTEDVLLEVLGDEAGEAIEILEGQHDGLLFTRYSVAGKTPQQNKIHENTGAYSFVNHEVRAGQIEAIIADGPDAEWKQKVARHAREAVIAALIPALPNSELHQIDIKG